uniref:Uncharacterized protein n=1 Tax=Oryza glumipatula TaxID=40148 RepID=A0A0E0BNW3_9ORYZ
MTTGPYTRIAHFNPMTTVSTTASACPAHSTAWSLSLTTIDSTPNYRGKSCVVFVQVGKSSFLQSDPWSRRKDLIVGQAMEPDGRECYSLSMHVGQAGYVLLCMYGSIVVFIGAS